jgi:uncharacterized protein YdhG (YjbR/CyaY superfamily)
MAHSQKGAKRTGFTDEEKAAMREASRERKSGGGGEGDVLAKIAAMNGSDRAIAERLHAIVRANAPGLSPKTWYGMPAYADMEGRVVCYFQSAEKFKTRYATLGFSDRARLDEGSMWPVAFALKQLTAAEQARVVSLLKRAAG